MEVGCTGNPYLKISFEDLYTILIFCRFWVLRVEDISTIGKHFYPKKIPVFIWFLLLGDINTKNII